MAGTNNGGGPRWATMPRAKCPSCGLVRPVGVRALTRIANEISDKIYDVSTSLTAGQSITVLRMVQRTLEHEIKSCEELVMRRTGMKNKEGGAT